MQQGAGRGKLLQLLQEAELLEVAPAELAQLAQLAQLQFSLAAPLAEPSYSQQALPPEHGDQVSLVGWSEFRSED